MRDRQLSTALDAMHPERLALDKIVAQRTLGFRGHALDDRQVPFSDGLPVLLQRRLWCATSSEQHQARGLAIDPMDDEGLLLRQLRECLQMLVENPMRSSFFLALRSHGEKP